MSERAMLSDRAVRVNGESRARAAEREARRILAETEPNVYPGMVRRYPCRPYEAGALYVLNGFAASDPNPWEVLAEALATFCALPSLEDLK